MQSYLILAFFIGSAVGLELIGRDQSAAVRGRLMCDGLPASGVTIKLYDVDTMDKDDKLGETKTNNNGEFQVGGWTKEITTIDPKLNIYHDCNDGIKPCQRKFSIKIPDSYVSHGKIPLKTYDAGTLQLAGKYPGESRDCIH